MQLLTTATPEWTGTASSAGPAASVPAGSLATAPDTIGFGQAMLGAARLASPAVGPAAPPATPTPQGAAVVDLNGMVVAQAAPPPGPPALRPDPQTIVESLAGPTAPPPAVAAPPPAAASPGEAASLPPPPAPAAAAESGARPTRPARPSPQLADDPPSPGAAPIPGAGQTATALPPATLLPPIPAAVVPSAADGREIAQSPAAAPAGVVPPVATRAPANPMGARAPALPCTALPTAASVATASPAKAPPATASPTDTSVAVAPTAAATTVVAALAGMSGIPPVAPPGVIGRPAAAPDTASPTQAHVAAHTPEGIEIAAATVGTAGTPSAASPGLAGRSGGAATTPAREVAGADALEATPPQSIVAPQFPAGSPQTIAALRQSPAAPRPKPRATDQPLPSPGEPTAPAPAAPPGRSPVARPVPAVAAGVTGATADAVTASGNATPALPPAPAITVAPDAVLPTTTPLVVPLPPAPPRVRDAGDDAAGSLRLAAAPPLQVARPDAATAATPSVVVATRPAQLAHDVGLAIARQVSADGDALHIRLDPPDLGRIDVRLSFDDRGTLRAVLAADSGASLDLLRRDSADLGRALADAGVRADAQSFRFEGRGDDRGGGSNSPQREAPPRPFTADPDLADTPDPARFRPLRWRGQLDVLA